MTADGALAVHHDPVIAGVGPVGRADRGELPGSVPLLGCRPRGLRGLSVNIEIKNLPGEPGFDPARAAGPGGGRPGERPLGHRASGDLRPSGPPALEAVRRRQPDLATGLLLAPVVRSRPSRRGRRHRATAAPPCTPTSTWSTASSGRWPPTVPVWPSPPGRSTTGTGLAAAARPRGRHRHHRRRGPRPGPTLGRGPGPASGRRLGCPDLGSRPDWSERQISTTMHGHERRRLCEADPRSGRPAGARSGDEEPGPRGKTHPRRLRLLRGGDGPAAGRRRRRGRGHPGVDGAQRGDLRPAHRPGHGGGQGHPDQRRHPGRHRCPGHGQGAGRRHQAGRARPGPGRHRVDRRLHRHHARADRRAARPSLGDLRQEGRDHRRHRSRWSARPRPATTRSRARCRPWSR